MKNVIYYTSASYFDPALHLVRELNRRVPIHLILQVAPESWKNALFDVDAQQIPAGLHSAKPFLKNHFPETIQRYWDHLSGFHLLVYNCSKSVHPSAWWTSHQAALFIKNLKPDLIHLDDVSLRQAWSVLEFGDIPIVLSIHDPESHSGEDNWRRELARRLTFGNVKRFILHNRHDVRQFLKMYPSLQGKVIYSPLGIYHIYREWQSVMSDGKGVRILFFGRLSKYKGLDVFMQAARQVSEAVPDAHFIIAGKPSPGYIITTLPVLANRGKFEIIPNYISNSKLAELFQNASIVVCPYLDATQSGVVLTAYAFGKPVVATRVGGLPEYVKDGITGLLVPPRNPIALAESIVKLIKNPLLINSMRRNIQELSKNELSWERIADQIVNLYNRLITEKKMGIL